MNAPRSGHKVIACHIDESAGMDPAVNLPTDRLVEIETRLAAVGRTAVGTKQFVVHAPTDLAALVAVVREVEAANDRYMAGEVGGVTLSVDIHAALQSLTATRPTPPTTDSPNEGTNA